MKRTMKALALALALAATLSLASRAETSKIATRAWTRTLVLNAIKDAKDALALADGSSLVSSNASGRVYRSATAVTASDGTTQSSGYEIEVAVSVPTNRALFVLRSTVGGVAAGSKYALAPGGGAFVCATNAVLSQILFSRITKTSAVTNDAGVAELATRTVVRWRAADSSGHTYRGTYYGNDTALVDEADYSRVIVIQDTVITDTERKTLLGGYGANAANAPPSLLSLLVPSAYAAEEAYPNTTYGFHPAVVTQITIRKGLKTYTYEFTDNAGDHEYNPYSGTTYDEIPEGEAYYRSEAAVIKPENWGFTFKKDANGSEYIEMKNADGETIKVGRNDFMKSQAWLDMVKSVLGDLPDVKTPEETEVEDPEVHVCKVYEVTTDEAGVATGTKHVGCVCDYAYCKYKPGVNTTYEIVTTTSKGKVSRETVSVKFVGAQHNWKDVTVFADEAGDFKYEVDAPDGCTICFQDPDDSSTHFCGNGSLNNVSEAHDYTKHLVNEPQKTHRLMCGCMCSYYYASEDIGDSTPPPMSDQHVLQIDADGNPTATGQMQGSPCWCFCRRRHSGDFPSADSKEECVGHCRKCGCYATYDGEDMGNRIAKDPMEYRVTDDGKAPKDLSGHHPKEDGKGCGCVCGVVQTSEALRDLFWNDGSFHVADSSVSAATCTCMCEREWHKLWKHEGKEGVCANVCDLCGCVDEKNADGTTSKRGATIDDHTPHEAKCGCQCYAEGSGFVPDGKTYCGYSGRDAEDKPGWHQRRSAECCCCECGVYENHASKGGKHKTWFINGTACRKICKGQDAAGQKCGRLAGGDIATDKDHTAKGADVCGCECGEMDQKPTAFLFHRGTGVIPCRCQCGYCHLNADITEGQCEVCRVCGETIDCKVPKDEGLHVLAGDSPSVGYFYGVENPDGTNGVGVVSTPMKCACYCGYYGSGTHEAKSHDLHFFKGERTDVDGTAVKNCRCDCERDHYYREWTKSQKAARSMDDELCPVCAYCRSVLRTGGGDGVVEVEASYSDHLARDRRIADGTDGASTKCGCRCGFVPRSAEDGTLPKFHPKYPGSCRCYGGKGDGTGEWHYLEPDAKCPNVCRFANEDGKHHKKANTVSYTEPVIGNFDEAGEYEHEPNTSGACGCKCGEYSAKKENLSPTGPLHVDAVLGCGCVCGERPKDAGDHRFPGLCLCYCEDYHNPNYDPKKGCEKICAECGIAIYEKDAVATRKGTVTVARKRKATLEDHSPKDDGCGCGCGEHKAEEYSPDTYPQYHNGSNSGTPCRCECGATHRNFRASACPKICATCEMKQSGAYPSVDDHEKSSCYCKCRKIVSHIANDQACLCLCGEQMSHKWGDQGCSCYCGEKVDHRKPSDQSCYCYCKEIVSHVFSDQSCYCYCGTVCVEHKFVDSQCVCLCGEAYRHISSPYKCFCLCGKTYSHKRGDQENCYCQCGQLLLSHVFDDGACKCKCGGVTDHKFADEYSCKCLCGEQVVHKFSDTSCTCYCKETTRDHAYAQYKALTEEFVCEGCGMGISKTTRYVRCSRCGYETTLYAETGHADGCGKDPDSGDDQEDKDSEDSGRTPGTGSGGTPCSGCGCKDGCGACESLSGVCAGCGGTCGPSETGDGELGDI